MSSRAPTGRPLISVIVPMLNELENIPHLVERMGQIRVVNADCDFEFVVVDDGSTDGSGDAVRDHLADQPIELVVFSRNFGSHSALSAGFHAARGDAVTWMGADLQEPLSLVTDFVAQWRLGNDVVWAVREERASGGALGRRVSELFWKSLHRFSSVKNYPSEGPSTFICDRSVVDAVNGMNERNRNILLLIAWVGFRQTTIRFVQVERKSGASKWTTAKLIKLAVDSMVQFSTAPIRAMSYLGSSIAIVGFVYALFLLGRAIIADRGPEGWTTVVVVTLILGGIQLLMLGVLGEYLWRNTDETRRRPLFVVDSRRSTISVGRHPTASGPVVADRSVKVGPIDSQAPE